MPDRNVRPILRDSYLVFIKNSLGSKAWQNFYAKVNGQKKDITDNGELSCAFFVSSALLVFGLINKLHLTVSGTVRDLKKSKWHLMQNPKIGAVLIWEATKASKGHKHIGFCVAQDKAVSINPKTGKVSIHHVSYHQKRKIEAIYFHQKLK